MYLYIYICVCVFISSHEELLERFLERFLERHMSLFSTILGQPSPSGAGGILETYLVMLGLTLRHCPFKLLKFLFEQALEGRRMMFPMFQSHATVSVWLF